MHDGIHFSPEFEVAENFCAAMESDNDSSPVVGGRLRKWTHTSGLDIDGLLSRWTNAFTNEPRDGVTPSVAAEEGGQLELGPGNKSDEVKTDAEQT